MLGGPERLSTPDSGATGLEATLRKVMEANFSYYRGLSRLTADYLGAVFGTLETLRLPVRLAPGGRPAAVPASEPPVTVTSSPQPPATAGPAMVLEGEAGTRVLGVFLVENKLQHRVSAPISASAFSDPNGREVRPGLAFEPEIVTLEPAEQLLVRVVAVLDEQLEPQVDYRGELTIPGLSGNRVKLVLRRRLTPPSGSQPKHARRPTAGRGTAKKPTARD